MSYKINLKTIRERKKLTQEEIAKILGISRSVYTKYENGYELIPIKHLLTFCNNFNIRVDQVFGLYYNPNTPINPVINKNLIGTRLKTWRQENKLTQIELAKSLNTTDSVISGYESARRIIATPFLYQICQKYHVSADYLLGRIDKNS